MFDPRQFRFRIVRPTLMYLGLWSDAAENLVMGTAAQESAFGTYLEQITGPAIGIYQIEQRTYVDLYENFLDFPRWASLRGKAEQLRIPAEVSTDFAELAGNLYYATAICRLIYYRRPEALPAFDDVAGLAHYWKQFFNTEEGKGKVDEFVKNYRMTF